MSADLDAVCQEVVVIVARGFPGSNPTQFRVVLEWDNGGWLAFARTQYSTNRLCPMSHPTPEGALSRLLDRCRSR